VQSQTITVPTAGSNAGFTATQTYTYDSLNRIKDAKEMIGTQTWMQTFLYDRYGNRNFDTTANRTTTIPSGCSVAVCNPSVNPATNKLVGYQFDNAGNTKVDANGQTFVYDSENKQVEVRTASNVVVGQYFYNGDGQRVKKIVPGTGETTVFVYDAAGKLVAEYSTNVAPASTAKVSYLTNDHLGSPRINTDANGAVISRHDYHPFGEEVFTTQRTTALGYAADTVRKKFTGYERDTETNLDFAQARYFNSSLGRYSSTDPLQASGFTSNPQSWNRYTYVGNNPLNLTDPNGLTWYSQVQENGDTIYRWFTEKPGDGWSQVENFVYNTQTDRGWVALDPYSGNWTDGYTDSAVASNSIDGSAVLWRTTQFFNGAADSLSPVNGMARRAAESFFGIDTNINESSAPYTGGYWTAAILNTAAGLLSGPATAGRAGVAAAADEAATSSSGVFQRVVSTAELDATQNSGLLRGGREGQNFFTNAASLDAKRAQIRLGLDGPLRDSRITFQIMDDVRIFGPQPAKAGLTGTNGGGLEFYTSRSTRIQILSVKPLKK
jgi:RHS repeat-associated protein